MEPSAVTLRGEEEWSHNDNEITNIVVNNLGMGFIKDKLPNILQKLEEKPNKEEMKDNEEKRGEERTSEQEISEMVLKQLGTNFIKRNLPRVWKRVGELADDKEIEEERDEEEDEGFNRSMFNNAVLESSPEGKEEGDEEARGEKDQEEEQVESDWDESQWGTNPINWGKEKEEQINIKVEDVDIGDVRDEEREDDEEASDVSENLLDQHESTEMEVDREFKRVMEEEAKNPERIENDSHLKEQLRMVIAEEVRERKERSPEETISEEEQETTEQGSEDEMTKDSLKEDSWAGFKVSKLDVNNDRNDMSDSETRLDYNIDKNLNNLEAELDFGFSDTKNIIDINDDDHENAHSKCNKDDKPREGAKTDNKSNSNKNNKDNNINNYRIGNHSNSCESSRSASKSEEGGGEDFSHTKEDKNNLSYFIMNLRGYNSKRESFKDIIESSDCDVVFISETHLYNDKSIYHNKYNFICRSRIKVNSKGGVAIGYKNELAPFVVKIAESKGDNEFLIIRVTCFEPNLVLGVYYGNQEGTAGESKIANNLAELFTELDPLLQEGLDVVIAGDFNVHIGEAVTGNEPSVSKGGKLLLSLCEDFGLEVANKISPLPNHTHFDITSKTSRILDIAITNVLDKHQKLAVDIEKKVTPYRIVSRKGEAEPNYSDHLTLIGEVMVKRSKKKSKIRSWRYSRPGGKQKYRELLEEKDLDALKVIQETEGVDEMFDKISQIIDDVKMEAFGVRTSTHKQREREHINNLAVKRMKDIQDAIDEMEENKKKLNEKVFIGRRKFEREGGETIEALKHYKTGELLHQPEEIYESILEYNVEVLEKKTDLEEEERQRMIENREFALFWESVETEKSEEPLQWEEYEEVVKKTHEANKGCYRDFNWAGPRWKAVMFLMFQRLYMNESIPEVFRKAALKKLYKKKGDKNLLQNYRFIHLRDWASKVFEKLVIIKSKKLIAEGTPESQIGGREKSSTLEHIVMTMTIARTMEMEKKALVLLFVDVMKCFDKIRLDDTLAEAAAVGVSGKQLRNVRVIHDRTVINIVGDESGKTATITNSTGQGSQMAPAFCSLAMARSLNSSAVKHGYGMEFLGVKLKPCSFVDDTKLIAETAEEARKSGKIAGESLTCMGLDAHPKKTKQVILGNKKARESIRKELEEEPTVMQGFEVEFSEQETYLGFEFAEKGTRESISQSIEKRGRLATAKTIQLVKVLEDDLINKVGFIAAAKTLFQSIVISTLSYGSQGYIFMSRKQEDRLESLMKDNLYRLLAISKFTSYAAVLFELNLVKMKDVVKMLKVSFIMSLIHEKASGQCLEVVLKEEEKTPGRGLIAEVKQICTEFGLPDVTVSNIGKEKSKEMMWKKARMELWKTVLLDRRVPYQDTPDKYRKDYWKLNKRKAKLVFAYKVGNLDFRNDKKGEAIRKFGTTECLAPGCGEKDEISHVVECSGYGSRPTAGAFEGDDEALATYLDELDRERYGTWRAPLMYRPKLGTAPKLQNKKQEKPVKEATTGNKKQKKEVVKEVGGGQNSGQKEDR